MPDAVAQQLKTLRQLGVDWYVRRDPASLPSAPSLPRVQLQRGPQMLVDKVIAKVGITPAPTAQSHSEHTAEAPADNVAPPVIEKLQAASEKSSREFSSLLKTSNTTEASVDEEPLQAVTVETKTEPFNCLLISYVGAVQFIIPVKTPKLSPVWQKAAVQLLNDICIAMGFFAGEPQLDYFNWPMPGQKNRFGNDAANDLLTGFVASQSKQAEVKFRVFLGEGISERIDRKAALMDGNCREIFGPALGHLIRDASAKEGLWQLLCQVD